MQTLICLCGRLKFLCILLTCSIWIFFFSGCNILLTVLANYNIGLGWYSVLTYALMLSEILNLTQCLISSCGLDLQWLKLHPLDDRRKPAFIGNPAFGGRGEGICRRNQRRKGKHRRNGKYKFDKTCGYPGEGWSNEFPILKLGTRNTRGM